MNRSRGQKIKQIEYFSRDLEAHRHVGLEPWKKSFIDRVTKELLRRPYKNKTIIDIGTGSGYLAVTLAQLGLKVIATDITPVAIKNLNKAKRENRLRNLTTTKSSAEKLPLRSKLADYVISNSVLEHVLEEEKAISELKRVAKPGGRIFVTVPIKLKHIWPFLWPLHYVYDKKIGHIRRYDIQDLEKKFGLKASKVFYSGHTIKIMIAIVSLFYKSKKLLEYAELKDANLRNKRYGATNISVIFDIPQNK